MWPQKTNYLHMKQLFFLFFLSILSLSCSDKKCTQVPIDIDKTRSVSISDLFESIDVVQLETTDQSLISAIGKVVFFENRYYILDLRQQTLFCFDLFGTFLFKISKKGQGTEEYTHLGDFNIDAYNNQLLLLDPFGYLLCFDLDGLFISKTRLPREITAYNEVYPMDKNDLAFVSLGEYPLVLYSRKKNEITDKKYKVVNGIRSHVFTATNKTYIYNGEVFFSPPPTNDVVNLSNDTVFSWNFGKKNNSQKQIDNLRELLKSEDNIDGRDFFSEGKLNYAIVHNHESSKYRICVIAEEHYNFKHVFFEKETKESFVFDRTKENIRFIFPDFCGESIIMYDRDFNTSLDMTFYDKENLSEEQNNIINSNNPENDNPFLVKYNFKK